MYCTGFTSLLNTTISGRTYGKCRLHGKIELWKGHKRVYPSGNCSCAPCTSHDQVLAKKNTQHETKEDRGRQWQMGLASGANLARSNDTATAGVSRATTSFPEMASSVSNDGAMLALQIANFETAKQAMEKTTLKAKWINSKICLRKISLNEYFKSILHYFGVNSLSGLTAHWCIQGAELGQSLIQHNWLLTHWSHRLAGKEPIHCGFALV